LGISLDSPETITKNIGALHSYTKYCLLLFEPTTIIATSVMVIHLERKGKNNKEEQLKKSSLNLIMASLREKAKERTRR